LIRNTRLILESVSLESWGTLSVKLDNKLGGHCSEKDLPSDKKLKLV
jgi:hypothetical protein